MSFVLSFVSYVVFVARPAPPCLFRRLIFSARLSVFSTCRARQCGKFDKFDKATNRSDELLGLKWLLPRSRLVDMKCFRLTRVDGLRGCLFAWLID